MATYYAGSGATGGGAGTSGDPYTLQELFDNVTSSDEGRILNDGTYTPSSTVMIDTNSGSTTANINIRGRNSADTAYEMATISGSSLPATTDLIHVDGEGARHYMIRDLRFTAATRHNVYLDNKDNSQMFWHSCRFDNATNDGIRLGNSSSLYFCEVDNNGGIGVRGISASAIQLVGCSLHDNTSYGAELESNYSWHFYNLYYDNSFGLVSGSAAYVHIIGCVFDRNTNDGWSCHGSNEHTVCLNSIFSSNGAYAIDGPATLEESAVLWDYNCYYNNTSGEVDGGSTPGENNVTSDPKFTSVTDGSEDYTLQSDSPCLAAGFPGSVGIVSAMSGNMDIGVLQRAAAGGGGAGGAKNPLVGPRGW